MTDNDKLTYLKEWVESMIRGLDDSSVSKFCYEQILHEINHLEKE